jgi:hypothetical protein
MALRFRGLDQPIEVVYRKDSGSAPTPVDPYEQAAAQYGLSTGTAEYNAALNRPNISNPLGSTTWSVGGYSGQPGAQAPASPGGASGGMGGSGIPLNPVNDVGTPQSNLPSAAATNAANPNGSFGLGGTGSTGGVPSNPNGSFGLGSTTPTTPQQLADAQYMTDVSGPSPGVGGVGGGDPYASSLYSGVGTGAPLYTESTQLAPQFESLLQQGINTNGIPELSGENLTPQLQQTENAVYQQNMGYLAPQEALATEGLNSQLAAEGATPGSAANTNAQNLLSQQQTFENTQAASGAVTAGEQEEANLYGLGGESLQAQIAQQQAPINEFNALQGGAGASATAQTPDISGAFAQQYQGQLAGYNAGVATNNADTSDAASLAAMAALYFA